ncbi:MAG TPA: RNA polymerase sigma-70 factor [Draconibacterium sp.]|nr:RNA polymerase sigma-70 factor [Draconibacterium sp.]
MTELENELIQLIKQGNHKSFELVFKSYYSRLCVYAFHYTKQLDVAEDLVKDTFLGLWERKENMEIKTSLSGYLFRSVHNSCINYLQREKIKYPNLSIEEIEALELKMKQPISPDYAIGHLLASELEDQIENEIEKLPDQCREIFKLSRYEGYSHKKIAKKLHISENTVKTQIFRALKRLKKAISSSSIILFHIFSEK